MATATTKRKYLLFSADDGRPDEVKNCAFFASEQGCRNGSSCKFKHEVGPSPVAAPAPAAAAKSSNNERPIAKEVIKVKANNNNTTEKKAATTASTSNNSNKPINSNNNNKIEEQLRQQQFIFADELEKQKKQLQLEYEEKIRSLSGPTQTFSAAAVKSVAPVPVSKAMNVARPTVNNSQQSNSSNTNNNSNNDSWNKRAKIQHPRTPIRNDTPNTSNNANNSNNTSVRNISTSSSSFQPLVDTSAFLSAPQQQQQDKWQDKQLNTKSNVAAPVRTKPSSSQQSSSPFVISQKPPQQQQQHMAQVDNDEEEEEESDEGGNDNYNYQNNSNNQANNHNNNDSDDDDNFIFQAVNTVVGTGNIPGLAFHSPGTATAAVVHNHLQTQSYGQQPQQRNSNQQQASSYRLDNINNNNNNPFRPVESTIQALKSSSSDHALYGSKKAAKVEKIQQKVLVASGGSVGSTSSIISAATINSSGTATTTAANGISWEALLLKTRQHPKFNTSYNFAARIATEPSAWVTAKVPGDWCNGKSLLSMLAIDCEMCESTDPITNEIDGTTLIRLSVVSGVDPSVTLIDVLVQPSWPISNMRTHIHGITADQLTTLTASASATNTTNGQPACVTLRQAQAKLLNICTASTVIVGQSLHNDLKALKFNHGLVIDTAFLCDRQGAVNESPSLKEISRFMLHVTLPEIHDSIRDAAVAMTIANYIHQNGYPKSVPRWSITTTAATASSATATTRSSATTGVSATASATAGGKKDLLIHRIPTDLSEQDIMNMMMTYTSIMPSHIDTITRTENNNNNSNNNNANNTANGRTLIHFMSSIHCELAFDSIAGPSRPDKGNNPQKRVYLKSGGYICIRK